MPHMNINKMLDTTVAFLNAVILVRRVSFAGLGFCVAGVVIGLRAESFESSAVGLFHMVVASVGFLVVILLLGRAIARFREGITDSRVPESEAAPAPPTTVELDQLH